MVMVVLKKPEMNVMGESWKCVPAVSDATRVDMLTSQSDPPSRHVSGVVRATASNSRTCPCSSRVTEAWSFCRRVPGNHARRGAKWYAVFEMVSILSIDIGCSDHQDLVSHICAYLLDAGSVINPKETEEWSQPTRPPAPPQTHLPVASTLPHSAVLINFRKTQPGWLPHSCAICPFR